MLKQKTPLKRKKPLQRRTPLRAKGIARAGAGRLTKRKIISWAKTPQGAAYNAEYNKWRGKVNDLQQAACGSIFCVACWAKNGGYRKYGPMVKHHWIYTRSDVRQYRFEPINGANICPHCHYLAHKNGKISFNEYRLLISRAMIALGILTREQILAVYDKKQPSSLKGE